MSMTLRNHIYFWIATTVLILGVIWLLKGVLLPFVLGAAIAYLLEPVMEFLSRKKLPRTIGAFLILLVFFSAVMLALAVITPVIYRQSIQLINAIPGYAEQFWELGGPYIGWLQEKFNNGDFSDLQKTVQSHIGKALEISTDVVTGLASGGSALVGTLSLFVITPLVAFFMMKEWNHMTEWFDRQIPRHSYDKIKGLLKEIDLKISGFIRGQFSVALVLGIIYATALYIAGLDFGLLIGFMAGLLSIIPLVGSTAGLIVSVAVAWFQAGTWQFVAVIAAIFMVGQFVEGNILTPRLLGKSVGLHPLWILFSIMAGGSLFGLTGMFLAVPVTASIGVLTGFALDEYRKSAYYRTAEPEKKKKTAKRKTTRKQPAAT